MVENLGHCAQLKNLSVLYFPFPETTPITAAQSGPVMYVENDHLMSKTPNRTPIVIKRLEGRNPDLARRFAGHGTFKIKKRKVSQD